MKITQDNYPELMHRLYIVNSGIFFSGVWVVVKPMLDKVTQKKIEIISGSGKSTLLKDISEENLPEFLGGKF